MPKFEIDPSNWAPPFAQIAEQVKRFARSGALKPGDLLPSLRKLGRELRLSPDTVMRAYQSLAREKVVQLKPGKGAILLDCAALRPNREALTEQARRLAIEASRLGMPVEELLQIVRQQAEQGQKL